LEVNEAAIQHYGYSREEFLAMTITDIRRRKKNRRTTSFGCRQRGVIWRHRRKNGSLIDVEVIWTRWFSATVSPR
jgi:PAS domain S-box-containing protein